MVVWTHTHWKALVSPTVVLIAVCAVGGFLFAAAVTKVGQPLGYVVLVTAAGVVGWLSIRPFLRWLATSYTITDRRIIISSGVLRRTGREVALQHVTDVSFERGLLDRLLGCGTVVVYDASDYGSSVLADVPNVRAVQTALDEVMYEPEPATATKYLPARSNRR